MYEHHPEENEAGRSIRAATNRPSVFDAFLRLLVAEGYAVPCELLQRNVSAPLKPSRDVQAFTPVFPDLWTMRSLP